MTFNLCTKMTLPQIMDKITLIPQGLCKCNMTPHPVTSLMEYSIFLKIIYFYSSIQTLGEVSFIQKP